MKVLHLTLKKKWFDMIASGEKKEEYRELKDYWFQRLTNGKNCCHNHYDVVRFTNGYSKGAPSFDIECKGIAIETGIEEWGAEPGKEYFVIKLGALIPTIKNTIMNIACVLLPQNFIYQ